MSKSTKRRRRPRRRIGLNQILFIILTVVVIVAVFSVAVFAVQSVRRYRAQAEEELRKSIALEAERSVSMELSQDMTCLLTLPDSVDILDVTFTSSDPQTVRVDASGRCDALSAGTAEVTASVASEKAEDVFSASCVFTVTEAETTRRSNEVTNAIKANLRTLRKNMDSGSQNRLFSLTVNRRTNVVTVYTYDENGNYTVPVRAMLASCGSGGAEITPTGSFSIYFKERWHPLYGDVYGQYVSGFSGAYLFHSVPYVTENAADLEAEEFNKLGTNASQGCVRLSVADCKWIYDHCPMNTPVNVIDEDASADPLGKPEAAKIDESVKWDPTDPSAKNPYSGKMPELSGVADNIVTLGKEPDLRKGVAAVDRCGNDISSKIKIYGTVLHEKKGDYYLTYEVTDVFGLTAEKTVCVTVQ